MPIADTRFSIIVPAHNSQRTLGECLAALRAAAPPDSEIIVVDDASTDDTADVLAGIDDARVRTARHSKNRGVGGAMITGFRIALDERADVIVKMDGDGQMDPGHLAALLDPIVSGGYTYAKGNRFLCEEQLGSMPIVRLIGTFILTFLTKLVSGYWHVFDPVNGYVAIDGAMLRRLPLHRLAARYFFETDLLVHLNIFNARVKDVEMPACYGDERSSMRLAQVLATFPVYLFRRFWYRLYEKHILREFSAVAVFWVCGLLFIAWGVGFGSYEWWRSLVSGHPATTGTVMLSALPLILGFQLVLQAMLIEIQESPR
jgi:glycosyltransferase involved in cell wall biosynthesis